MRTTTPKISNSQPNATTIAAIKAADRGEGFRCTSLDEVFSGISDRYKSTKAQLLAPRYSADDVPPGDSAGVYAFFLSNGSELEGFCLKNMSTLYVGMTASSLKVRNHFHHRDSGFSTLRRSLGAILKGRLNLEVIPRGSGNSASDYRNFRFTEKGEEDLTSWMKEHLTYSFVVLQSEIERIERELIDDLCPPLNLKATGCGPMSVKEEAALLAKRLSERGPSRATMNLVASYSLL